MNVDLPSATVQSATQDSDRRIKVRMSASVDGAKGHRVIAKRRLALAMVWFAVVMADSSAQTPDPTTSAYAAEIYKVVQAQWVRSPYYTEAVPASTCAALITQMPGGNLLNVQILPECDFGDAGRAAVVAAARNAAPLPYRGFEQAFQRDIRFVFRAPTLDDIEARVGADAEEAMRHKTYAALSATQLSEARQVVLRTAEYVQRCRMHLFSKMPGVRFEKKTLFPVTITVDEDGEVVRVVGEGARDVDKRLVAALLVTQPCEAVPDDIMAGKKELEFSDVVGRLTD